jgi:UDP-glucose 4-epimerase
VNCLITGGAGFIGSHLGDILSTENKVWAFDNYLTGRERNRKGVIELDIRDRQRLYLMANEVKPKLIIHCAASYSDPDRWHLDTDTNVSGAINIANVARYHEAHLIYFQTILPPVSSYAISKIAAEQYLRLSGVPLTVFRLGNIYGPRNISGPIPVFYKRLTQGQPVTVVNTTRDMVFISDLVRAVRLVIEHGLTGTFDVCSGVQTPISQMYGRVRRELGMDYDDIAPVDPLTDDVQGTVDPENGVPFWVPVVTLRDGIKRTVDAYKEDSDFPTHTHLRIGAAHAS